MCLTALVLLFFVFWRLKLKRLILNIKNFFQIIYSLIQIIINQMNFIYDMLQLVNFTYLANGGSYFPGITFAAQKICDPGTG